MNFQIFKLVLEKAEEPEIKLPTSAGSSKKQEFQKNIYFCFFDYAKTFVWITTTPTLSEFRYVQEYSHQFKNKKLPATLLNINHSHSSCSHFS